MFDLFLNTAKFFTSEDARKSASALIEMIRRSPEWQKDICTLDAHIQKSYDEQAMLLSDLTTSKMQNMDFASEAVTAFKSIFLELIRNAFEHGCKSEKDSVSITIEITQTFVSLKIVNPKRRKFNLKTAIETNKSVLTKNLSVLRGRGLILVKELADSLKMVEDGSGVKAVVYSERVSFKSEVFDGLAIVTLKNGLFNPAVSERLSIEVGKFPKLDVIINLRNFSSDIDISTEMQSEIIKLSTVNVKTISVKTKKEISKKSSRKIVTLLALDAPENIMLPKQIIVYSWKEALTKLGKGALLNTDDFPYKDREVEKFGGIVISSDLEGMIMCPNHGPYLASSGCPYPPPHGDNDRPSIPFLEDD